MPLDVLGRTRATLTEPASLPPWPEGLGNLVKLCRDGDRTLQLLFFNEEYLVSVSHQLALITVPALCTHRPSLLPIEWLSEASGLAIGSSREHLTAEKLYELGHLEEVKVVTRFP